MIKNLIAAVAITAVSAGTAQAVVLVSYEPVPMAGSINANAVGPTVVGAPLARDAGLAQTMPVPGNNYNSSGFGTPDKASAVTAGDFLTWGFTSTTAFDLSNLAIAYGRGINGPTSIAIDLSINGGMFFEIFTDDTIQVGVEQNPTIDLSSFDNVTQASFRLIGFSAATLAGRFSLADTDVGDFDALGSGIVVSGDASVVSVPASASLLFAGFSGILLLRKQRRPQA